jgi:hypothetical protein
MFKALSYTDLNGVVRYYLLLSFFSDLLGLTCLPDLISGDIRYASLFNELMDMKALLIMSHYSISIGFSYETTIYSYKHLHINKCTCPG